MISVVCPYYNESAILEAAITRMLRNLATLPAEWELIVVNDGSKDGSAALAEKLAAGNPHLRAAGYPVNRGRGFAIRTGVAAARGDIVVTTEIDCSWGDDIVHRIAAEFEKRPDADIIIASPHLPGGGYKNVPPKRVFLSTMGNYIIRSGLTYHITMNTGMTRGYRREKFLALPLTEDEKEQHLEIVNKALAFNYRIYEIPAVLEWQDHRLLANPGKQTRKSSANIQKLVRTHVLFSVLAAPFRYLYVGSAGLLLLGAIFLGWAVVNLFTPAPSVYVLMLGLLLWLFSALFFGVAVLAQQGRMLQRELWRVQSMMKRSRDTTVAL